jgi:hypothetical protein
MKTTSAICISGEGGKSLQSYFDEQGGATAYLGTTVPKFPNFFILFGALLVAAPIMHTEIRTSQEPIRSLDMRR